MFDGASTVGLSWDGPEVVLYLAAVPIDSEAPPLDGARDAAAVAAHAGAEPQRVQVLDDA